MSNEIMEHEMVNWSCQNCGMIEEDTGFKNGCKAELCGYCGKMAIHKMTECPERIQL